MPDYGSMIAGFDEVEEAPLMEDGALPKGWYPLEIAAIQRSAVSQNGVPMVTTRMRVFDGPCKGRSTFITHFLGASEVDPDGSKRKDSDFHKANATIQSQMKRFLKSIGVQTAVPYGEGIEQVLSFYNVDAWVGQRFMGSIRLKKATVNKTTGKEYDESNDLSTFTTLDDTKHGLDATLRGGKVAATATI